MKEKVSKKEKREQRIKKSIIRAAKQLFSLKGYKDTTVDEITDKALIAKATLYQYFKSKENLFLETIKDSETNIISLLKEKVLSNPDLHSGKKKIRALFHYLLGYFEKDSYAIHMAFYRESHFNEEIITFIQKFFDHLSEQVQKVLLEAGMTEKDSKNLSTSIIGSGYVHIVQWYVDGRKEPLKELSTQLFNQFYPYIIMQIKGNQD